MMFYESVHQQSGFKMNTTKGFSVTRDCQSQAYSLAVAHSVWYIRISFKYVPVRKPLDKLGEVQSDNGVYERNLEDL